MVREGTADAKRRDLKASWQANAGRWVHAVREDRIASRTAAPDDAIIEAVLARRPKTLLDLGCGEGWLVHTLIGHGIEATGVDGSPALIEAARNAGGGRFLERSYDEIAAEPDGLGGPFDVITANFALFDDRIEPLLETVGTALLAPLGRFLVQTLHPAMVEGPYEDGWRAETFAAMDDPGWQPMPWHFRTLGSWISLFRRSGGVIERVGEPLDPRTARPLSVLFEVSFKDDRSP